jgi:hypothetical protein
MDSVLSCDTTDLFHTLANSLFALIRLLDTTAYDINSIQIHAVAYLLRARTVEPEKQPLLARRAVTMQRTRDKQIY